MSRLSIPSLDTVTIVHIPIIDDWIDEPTEEFFLELSGRSCRCYLFFCSINLN